MEGYPKTLKEELGIDGRVDAAFLCPNEHTVHIIQGEVPEHQGHVSLVKLALETLDI